MSSVVVEVIDKKASPHKKAITKLAIWLVHTLAHNGSVEVFLVSDAFMQKNVLAFPAPKAFPRPDLGVKQPLGEIYLNPIYISRHNENLEHMLVHGFLHLLGYDHIKKNDRMAMERKENQLLKSYAAAR